MKVHPLLLESPGFYGNFYIINQEASLILRGGIILLAEVIPEYSHQDVYNFLTKKGFRKSIVNAKENRRENNFERSIWLDCHEQKIGKGEWYKQTIEIVEGLIINPEPPPILPYTPEAFIYQIVESSQQQVIPISFRCLSGPSTMHKEELLILFDTLGIEIEALGNVTCWVFTSAPAITLRFPGLSFLNEGHDDIGINGFYFFLPNNEFYELEKMIENNVIPDKTPSHLL